MENFARPGQILGWLQFKTMYLYASKTAPIWLFEMLSSTKQAFYTLWTRLLHIQKSKNILFWPSNCTKSKLDNLLVGPSWKTKLETDMLSWFILKTFLMTMLDRSGLPDTAVDYEKALEARKLLSASDLHGKWCHSERTTQITAVDYKKALESRKLLSASDLHGDRCHSERTMQTLTQQCRRQALLDMSA